MKRIRREADRVARQMRAEMCEPATRLCDLVLWPTLRDVFPNCNECKPGMRERVCGMDFQTAYLADLNNADAIDEECEFAPSVQACAPIPWPRLRLDEVDNDYFDDNCDGVIDEGCEFAPSVQACQTTDDDWILDKYEPYEVDDLN